MKTLAYYQDRMIEIADAAKPLIATRDDAVLGQLATLRLSMGQTLASYQLHFHREIYEKHAAQGADLGNVSALREIKTECIVLAEDFRRHCHRWAATDAAADWHAYAESSVALGLRIRSHIARVRARMRRIRLPECAAA